jgi:hypothetical protein
LDGRKKVKRRSHKRQPQQLKRGTEVTVDESSKKYTVLRISGSWAFVEDGAGVEEFVPLESVRIAPKAGNRKKRKTKRKTKGKGRRRRVTVISVPLGGQPEWRRRR